jgi:fibronectin-binding autotransporter adhesin
MRRRLLIEALEDRVTPATISWTGGGLNDFWTNGANWNLNRAPVAGDDLVFGNLAPASDRITVNNITVAPTFKSITISASGYSISGLPGIKVTLSGTVNVGSNLGTETITADLQLNPPPASPQQTFTINTGSNLVLAGKLSGSSNPSQAALQTLTKAGPGTLELTNDNSAYIGAFTLASGGGVVSVAHPNALGLGTLQSTPTRKFS